MTSDEVRARLSQEPDFIYLPRFDFSLAKLMERYPDGVPDKLVAQGLMMTEEEVQSLFLGIVAKLRRTMGIRRALAPKLVAKPIR